MTTQDPAKARPQRTPSLDAQPVHPPVAPKIQPEKREAQQSLAREMTEMAHGADALAAAEEATQILFGADPTKASAATLREIRDSIPQWMLPADRLRSGVQLVDALAESGLSQSKGQARKDIEGGGISVNNQKASDAAMMGQAYNDARRKMEEGLEAIVALLRMDGPVSMETDWFRLQDAQLQLHPYQRPCFPIFVAANQSPAG